MMASSSFAGRLALARSASELTVSRIVGDVSTFVAVEPYRLDTFPDVVVDRITDASVIDSALDAIEAGQPYISDWNIDTRACLVFSDAAGNELLAVYLGTFEWSGQIGGQLCVFEEPSLRRWLLDRYVDT